jgi:hypothetical protein
MDEKETEAVEKEYDALLEKNFVEKLKIKKNRLSPEALKDRIIAFLEENPICTLATCSHNLPRSTPVRFRSKGLTIYILAEARLGKPLWGVLGLSVCKGLATMGEG